MIQFQSPTNPQSHSFSHQSTIMLQIMLALLLFSSVSTAQVQYFINCGSSTDAKSDSQTFVPENSDGVLFSKRNSKTVENTSLSADKPYYQTARVFNEASSYDFSITKAGYYYMRLHFYAFNPSLADANFSVSAVGRMLLPDFIPGKSNPISKEFIIKINLVGRFRIYFVPSASSLAFVNAIEVVNTTSNTAQISSPYVTPAGSKGAYKHQQPDVLETIYRINVGGNREVKPSYASGWTTWDADDQYLMNKGAAEKMPPYDSGVTTTSSDDAPKEVYTTARFTTSNLIWEFNVSKHNNYSIRVYFCDISPTPGPNKFDLYIYQNFNQIIDTEPLDQTTAFSWDFTVGSDSLDLINISVRTAKNSGGPSHPFLNGLEILQVIETTVEEPLVDNVIHKSNVKIIISLVASAVVIFVILGAAGVFLHRRRKQKRAAEAFEWGNLPLYGATSSHYRTSGSTSSQGTTFQNLQLGLKIPFSAIQRVTNNFDDNLIVGEGGFGKVYKGTLTSGFKVAVKRGGSDHGQGILEFQTEITILSKIRHRHLVSLFGYCCENGEMILVYEFMEKGTLRYHLYDWEKKSTTSSTKGTLSWRQRLEICIGAAKGIQYLHTGTNKGIIHRDVKSTNILLDENYVAKVADFGLSRSGYLDETHVSISDVKGTLGYLDPEYIICLQLTEKSDVYSFGVVLLEVLCARPVIDHSLPKEQVGLNEWAMTCYEEGQLESIIDPSIADEINQNSLMKFWETAEGCLKKDATERPPMSDVCWGLEYALQLQIVATERVLADDSTTDASLNMTLPAVRRFPSQSIVDYEYNDELLNTNTGEVFSQLTSDDGSAR